MATLGETATVLKRLAAAYGQTITTDQARAYHAIIGQYARLEMAQAAIELMGEKTFLPRPAELRGKIMDRRTKGKWMVIRSDSDEACLWRMFEQGINSPGELSADEIKAIYGPGTVIPDGEYINKEFYYSGERK